MGRSILLWLLGVPIPIIILLPQSQKHRVRPALKACNAISAVAGIGFDNVQSQTRKSHPCGNAKRGKECHVRRGGQCP